MMKGLAIKKSVSRRIDDLSCQQDLAIERLFGEIGDSALGIERRFRETYEWDKEYNCDLERQVTRTSI